MNSKVFQTPYMLCLTGLVWIATAANAHAMGKEKTPVVNVEEIGNKVEYLETKIREFNVANDKTGIELGSSSTRNADRGCGNLPEIAELQRDKYKDVCAMIQPILPEGRTCADVLEIKGESFWSTESISRGGGVYGVESVMPARISCTPRARFSLSLTAEGRRLAGSILAYDSKNRDIEYNVRNLSTALKTLFINGEQKKMLDGLFSSTDAFLTAIDAESAKAKKGLTPLPLMHSTFVSHATLITSYYRYLALELRKLQDFRSQNAGRVIDNREAVVVVEQTCLNLATSYGLEGQNSRNQVGDYGRVFLDVSQAFQQGLTVDEKEMYTQPMVRYMALQVVPVAVASGDRAVYEQVLRFKDLWERPELQIFLRSKLSASDERINHQIMTMSNLAYQIGRSAGVDIRAMADRDAQGVVKQKTNEGR